MNPEHGNGEAAAAAAADERVRALVAMALAEDLAAAGDVTSLALVPSQTVCRAEIAAREALVVCGVEVAAAVFAQLPGAPSVAVRRHDGTAAEPGTVILEVEGRAQSVLAGERTALNFLQRLSGIATLTRRFVDAVREQGTTILDTRKTTPGYRWLEKYAVRCGGGSNHRAGLYDRVLIKDNHRRFWNEHEAGRLDLAVRAARRRFPDVPVEIEVESPEELACALRGEPDWVLLDNMSPELLGECVRVCAGRARLEASGGITLANVRDVARTGVDAVSLGCLTHSAPAADLSLEVTWYGA